MTKEESLVPIEEEIANFDFLRVWAVYRMVEMHDRADSLEIFEDVLEELFDCFRDKHELFYAGASCEVEGRTKHCIENVFCRTCNRVFGIGKATYYPKPETGGRSEDINLK